MTTATKEKQEVSKDTILVHRRRWHPLLEVLIAIIAIVMSLEFLFWISNLGEQEWVNLNEVHGYLPFANKKVTYRKEGLSHLKFNSQAMNDRELTLEKPAFTKRIAVIGDSYVMSIEVDRQDNFCSQLQSLLDKRGSSSKYQVMNFGVAGYGLNQIYTLLEKKVFDYKPDLVIFPYTVAATCTVSPTLTGPLPKGPYYFLQPDGSLKEDHTVQELWKNSSTGKRMEATRWFREHSRIWGVISTGIEQVYAWNNKGSLWKNFIHTDSERIASSPPKHSSTTSQVTENSIKFLWPTAEAMLLSMNELCKAHNCQFVLLRLPIKNGKESPNESKYLKQLSDSSKIVYLDYADLFKDNVMSEKAPFYDVHLSPSGHKEVAEQLLKSLSPLLSPRPASAVK